MFDSILNTGDFLSDHWLAEVYPGKLSGLVREWREAHESGKATPWHGLQASAGTYLAARADLDGTGSRAEEVTAVTRLHTCLLEAVGIAPAPTVLETFQGETQTDVPLLARVPGVAGEALHVLQARPVQEVDALLAGDAELVEPLVVHETAEKRTEIRAVGEAVTRLCISDQAPRYLLVVAGDWVLLTDPARWSEGRYLAFDVNTALARGDRSAQGELAWHAGLWSADVLLPNDEGTPPLDGFTEDSTKHAIGVSEELRDGLRVSVELIANEVIRARREKGMDVEGVDELPRELTLQSLRFLYRILFLLYAEARPELGILPSGAPEYASGYGLDRLRDLVQVPLTDQRMREGTHLHDSLRLLFRLVNDGHGHAAPRRSSSAGEERASAYRDQHTTDELTFEPLRADLFDPRRSRLIDGVDLRNEVLQEVLSLLLLAKGGKGKQGGFISYALLGINQLGAVYEGLMSYSGFIAGRDLLELAKDGNAEKGTWLVPVEEAGEYDEKHVVRREDRTTGELRNVIHPRGTFVYRLSGRDRQRSASYYTPEVLTRCVVKHALAELITDETTADDILEYRICEPALGSGAFLNEAINQLATAYLRKREAERGEHVPPDRWQEELQRVKAWLALHRSYGVDLNATAVELAEVSLWLNVMYPGLKAPWFGLHLKRGNSLIGARRATYDLAALGKGKKTWWKEVARGRHLAEYAVDGGLPDGEIHHFLLPAADWGAVGSVKQVKELREDEAADLRTWQKRMRTKPDKRQTERLRGLARRVERLWALTERRLQISEREISRHIDLWGMSDASGGRVAVARDERRRIETNAVTREEVERALLDPDGPYLRLRLVMDAWCALWYWPVTTAVAPPDLDEWLATLEGLLGIDGKTTGDARLHELAGDFTELGEIDDLERQFFFMRDVAQVLAEHPWLGIARDIAQREGFFHWELDFAQVFARGGFDLQVGNPPWVRLDWSDNVALAEHDPYFLLTDKIPEKTFRARRATVLEDAAAERAYLHDLESWAGTVEHLGSEVDHPVLQGLRSNLYMNFMERTWASNGPSGVVGLLHPESHFTDPKAGRLRAATYRRIRRHWQFENEFKLFEEVHNQTIFGIQIYGAPQDVAFLNATSLFQPETIDLSFTSDPAAEVPGVQYPWGGWDARPHPSRIMTITEGTLAEWAELFDPPGTAPLHARMVRPLTDEHLDVLATLARAEHRMADTTYWWSSGWNETTAKQDGYIEWRTETPVIWDEVVLQGPHFTVATPFNKQPNPSCKSNKDYSAWDLETLPRSIAPRTNYQRASDRESYDAAMTHWDGRRYTDFWRLAWRRMAGSGGERSLQGALVPPGPTHVHTVHTLALGTDSRTVVTAGLWSSIPLDYLFKVSGKGDVQDELIRRFPAPLDHPAEMFMLLRTLRLNCLTREYSPLWEELFKDGFAEDAWTAPFVDLPALCDVHPQWSMATPLRTDQARRAALVEIDALAAIMLGLTADQLALMYRAQFPVLRKYEYEMFFDANGRKVAGSHHAAGVRQGKDDYKIVKAWVQATEDGVTPDVELPELYTPPFTRPDREAEMRAAHAEFCERLGVGLDTPSPSGSGYSTSEPGVGLDTPSRVPRDGHSTSDGDGYSTSGGA